MVSRTLEIERKYEMPKAAELPQVPGTVRHGPDALVLDAIYHDTTDLRLARAGITLRRRTGGEDAGWHLKLGVDTEHRTELREPLRKKLPESLAEAVRGYTRGAALAPVAHIRTHRQRWTLSRKSGRALAEVVVDDVSAQTLGESATLMAWREVEVELLGGDPGLLDRIGSALAEAGIERSSAPAKLTRVLGDRLPTRVTRKPKTAGEVVLAYLRAQVATIAAQDVRVRLAEEDSVHQLRVATRRARSALQAFRKVVPGQRALIRELRWLGAVLGESRDREVLLERFTEQVSALPDELVLGGVRGRLTEHFTSRPPELAGDRYFALRDALDRLVADPPTPPLAGRPAAKVLIPLVRKAWRRVERARRGGDKSLHDVRKAAKRFRYAAETVVPAVGKPAEKSVRRAKSVQKLLGEHQDTVAARGELRALGVQAHLGGDNGFTYGLLHAAEAQRAEQVEAEFPAVWRKAAKPKRLRWLKRGELS
ncbi:CYTH and CHAD domain-containing protein [Kutzneria viridogrisea]|uniref:CHAD domain-containing protein n=1 Tax=Kutzneria viridogrisea TaxID=47990 RepID=A0ABR6BCD8_9PSEU|nr:CHAD domain-containing protein [Kutzneria viridogrisea]